MPNFDIFLEPIISELSRLEYGIDVRINETNKTIKFFTIAGVYDKPARAGILNILRSTGYSSCLKCLQEGTSVQTAKGIDFSNLFYTT